MSSYKRNIFILTDDVELVLDKYSKYFKKAEFAKSILVDDISNFSSAVMQQIDNARNTILFLTKTDTYIENLFLNSAVMHIVENQSIDFIVVDSISNWSSMVEIFDDINSEQTTKVWTKNENLFDWYHVKRLIRCLEEHAVPENVIIAFVSDNYRYIDKLFDDLLKKWGGDDDDDGDGDDGPINSRKHLPINKHLPKLFMGWIWRIWYAPTRKEYRHYDSDVKEEDTDVVGYVRRSVILNLGDKSITYIHIVPNMLLDLSEVLDDINELYVDLNTNYGSIFFTHEGGYPSHVNYVPFLSRVKFMLYSMNDYINVVKNYLDISNLLLRFKEYHIMNNFEGDVTDKITHTVTTTSAGRLEIPRMAIIKSIDPPERIKDETEPGPVEEEPDATPINLEELAEALADDEVSTIRLDADITDAVGLSIRDGSEKTIDLNGYSLIAASDLTEDNWALKVFSGKLTITGEGNVNGGSGCPNDVCIWAYGEDSEINIYGGNYDVGLDVNGDTNSTIYSEGGATINIYGGEFSNSGAWSIGKDGHVLNIKNNDGSYIICYGGTYNHQNPADGDDKDTTTGSTFLADGYEVEELSDGGYIVVAIATDDDDN